MTEIIKCPIWGTPADQLAHSYGDLKVFSARTDGEYRITDAARGAVSRLTDDQKARLTTWLVDQRRFGEARPLITNGTLEEAIARRPLKTSERKERFFLLATHRGLRPGTGFKTAGTVDEAMTRDVGAISAWTECRNDLDRSGLLGLLMQEHLVQNNTHGQTLLTPPGFYLMESLESAGAPTRQAFIAMWFDQSMDEVFRLGFAPAVQEAGYVPMRIDRKEHGNKIDDEIIAEIRRSRFVIADFTCGLVTTEEEKIAIARGGVYYEAGFAQGLKTPVIWTCRKDCIDYVHFDTRQYNHLVWETAEELRPRLANRIRAQIV